MATFYLNHESELYHHGILGMHWGIRRYQNKDGSLTPAGEARYRKKMAKESEKANKELVSSVKHEIAKSGVTNPNSVRVEITDGGHKDGVAREIRINKMSQAKLKDGSYSEEVPVEITMDKNYGTASDCARSVKVIDNKIAKALPTARDKIADEMYETYSKYWYDPVYNSGPKLSKKEFREKISPEWASADQTSDGEFFFMLGFDDAGCFEGHTIVVDLDRWNVRLFG